MPKNILIDLNVILDLTMQRTGWQYARDCLKLAHSQKIQMYISAHEVTTFAYLLESKKRPRAQRQAYIIWLLSIADVVPTGQQILRLALNSDVTDFEDAVIEQAALVGRCEYVITRNVKDFTKSVVPALTPKQFLTLKS